MLGLTVQFSSLAPRYPITQEIDVKCTPCCRLLKAQMYSWSHPPGIEDGVRVAICVTLFLAIGLALNEQLKYNVYLSDIQEFCSWGAITSIVVSSPLIGKAAQTGAQRFLGTYVGGSIGIAFLYSGQVTAYIIMAFILTILATCAGTYLKADYGGKLCIVTFILVVGYTPTYSRAHHLLIYSLGRIFAISVGVCTALTASVFVFPKSATEIVLIELRNALQAVSDLHCACWEAIDMKAESSNVKLTSGAETFMCNQGIVDLSGSEQVLRKCEDAQLAFDNAIRTVEDHLAITVNEICIGVLFGHRILLPKWLWFLGLVKTFKTSALWCLKKTMAGHCGSSASISTVAVKDAVISIQPEFLSPPLLNSTPYRRSAPLTQQPDNMVPSLQASQLATPSLKRIRSRNKDTTVRGQQDSVSSASCVWLMTRPTIPPLEVSELCGSLRRLAHTIWSHHLALADGFGEDLMVIFRQRYPSHLLQAREHMHKFLQDALIFYSEPGKVCQTGATCMPLTNLEAYGQCVTEFLEMSLKLYAEAVKHVKDVERVSTPSVYGEGDYDYSHNSLTAQQLQGQERLPFLSKERREFSNYSKQIASPVAELPALMIPATEVGYEARLRWDAKKLAMQQMYEEACGLRQALHNFVPLVPGNGPCA
ncbi:hypothetical protein CEUSTIGMA_g3592.t1 [Chlamydomonas eustigma]|uniref:Uncharacterized protein n=1 Tax=Chlamydomonas eustigma TaxID=1157962 RepID=A0A250WZ82_9CHLO|nr:hypothetical protein CEUSTIGMA_g3592.t1 [Chlamydomonas eustigma]|eukprot:GAX76148.1 hypothetical protein CEUSTIGMA_g3592.t1 [Chlamydomonas eustigma]